MEQREATEQRCPPLQVRSAEGSYIPPGTRFPPILLPDIAAFLSLYFVTVGVDRLCLEGLLASSPKSIRRLED